MDSPQPPVWLVQYDGSYLGGHAVVVAPTAEEAIALVQRHPNTVEFTNVSATPVMGPVYYNNCGEY